MQAGMRIGPRAEQIDGPESDTYRVEVRFTDGTITDNPDVEMMTKSDAWHVAGLTAMQLNGSPDLESICVVSERTGATEGAIVFRLSDKQL